MATKTKLIELRDGLLVEVAADLTVLREIGAIRGAPKFTAEFHETYPTACSGFSSFQVGK